MKTLLSALLLLSPSLAFAEGALIDAAKLPSPVRTQLSTAISRGHRESAAAFEAVKKLHDDVPALDQKKRGRVAPIAPFLKTLGKDAALPILEQLAFDSAGRDTWRDSAWRAWRVGLLEALGPLKDERARPVLELALSQGDADSHVVRATSAALAHFNDDRAAEKLVQAASKPGPAHTSIIEGMGSCRRLPVATALATELEKRPSETDARALIKALGSVGNAWAWETLADRSQEKAVRATAAKALVSAFVSYSGDARNDAAVELKVVNAPETAGYLALARQKLSPEAQGELDALASKLQANPVAGKR